MGRVLETVSTFNSFLRTLLAIAVLGGVAAACWLGYRMLNEDDLTLQERTAELAKAQGEIEQLSASLVERDETISRQTEQIEEQLEQIDKLETAMQLLKVDHRLAQLTVVEQAPDEASGDLYSTIEFVELNDQGRALGEPRRFRVKGDVVYIDYYIVKFDDAYVERADLDRGTSICLFRRIFGEFQEPQEGFVLDKVGSRPEVYARGGAVSEFERQIWDDFWNIAHDPQRARELGIRAAHGEAVSIKVRPESRYRVLLRASGGLSITPAERVEPPLRPMG